MEKKVSQHLLAMLVLFVTTRYAVQGGSMDNGRVPVQNDLTTIRTELKYCNTASHVRGCGSVLSPPVRCLSRALFCI